MSITLTQCKRDLIALPTIKLIMAYMQKAQDQKSKIEEVLKRLRRRESELFTRIIDAIHNQDDYASRVLASEVAGIRKAIVTIENAGTDVLTSHPKYPELLLCPSCCSPEISISQSKILPKCHCLDCGKIWIARMDYAKPKWIENLCSLA
jgi:hypothetical protein